MTSSDSITHQSGAIENAGAATTEASAASETVYGWPTDMELILPGSPEPYIAATNLRPIGPSTWLADWREKSTFGSIEPNAGEKD